MTQNNVKLSQQLAQSKLELVKLQTQEKELIFNFGANHHKLLQVQNNITHLNSKVNSLNYLLNSYGEENVDLRQLENDAYYGDLDALNKLISLTKSSIAGAAKSILSSLAQTGDGTICSVLVEALPKDLDILEAIIKGNSSYSEEAAVKYAENMGSSGTSTTQGAANSPELLSPTIRDLILDKLCSDPERNIHLIAKFSNTQAGIQALSNVAIDKPTTSAGHIAARALGKAFLSGNAKISSDALKALKSSALAGNVESVNTLVNVVKSNAATNSKAIQAIDVLAEIAQSSSQSGSEVSNTAMGALVNIAKDKSVSPVLRNRAIQNLGNLIAEGADTTNSATDAVIGIARTDNNQSVKNQAIYSIFKASESNNNVRDRAVDLFEDVASGRISADKKMKFFAIDLLEQTSASNSTNAKKAGEALGRLTENTDQAIATRSLTALKKLGLAADKDNLNNIPSTAKNVDGKDAKRLQSNNFIIMT
jgi:hypothetical protein